MQISFVKAVKEFFGQGEHGRTVTIPEFKALTTEDKLELRDMMIAEGLDVAPLAA